MRRAKAEWSDPMPRGARIAGWIYFPIHVVVLPLTIGMLLWRCSVSCRRT